MLSRLSSDGFHVYLQVGLSETQNGGIKLTKDLVWHVDNGKIVFN
jgi:hypothetical protein